MKKILPFFLLILLFFSCSLNYENQKEEKIVLPDFYFENLTISKIEGGKLKTRMFARSLEQYNKSKMSFASGVNFDLYNDEKLLEVQGQCGLLSVNPDDEIYTMFNDIEIKAYEQNLAVKADAIKWNNKTEQLSAPEEYSVTITNDIFVPENAVKSENKSSSKMTLTGKKFSASGVSRRYSFGKSLHGKVETGTSSDDDFIDNDFIDDENDSDLAVLSDEAFDLEATLKAFSEAGFSVELDSEKSE